MPAGLSSRCPHCQKEVPLQGRFCVMCGRRIEGWTGLLSAPKSPAVPEELPSQHEATRPAQPDPHLLERARTPVDEESLRPTREMPSVGHELRARAPDHRVHTSPTGTALPQDVLALLERPAGSRRSPRRLARADGAPLGPLPDEPTDHIRIHRPSRVEETFRLLLLAGLCAGVAVAVGLLAYRLMLPRPADGGAGGTLASAPERSGLPQVPARSAGPPGTEQRAAPVYRTRDLVVSVSAPFAYKKRPPLDQLRRGRAQGKPGNPSLAAPLPADTGTFDGAAPGPPAEAPRTAPAPATPMTPMTEEEQRSEAEAQLAAADIEFVASNHDAQVRQCHDRAFKEVPGGSPEGKVELSFTLNEEGRAVDLATAINTTGSDSLARCLVQRVSEWRFPRPLGGARVYQFPFVFLPVPDKTPGGR